ncbi:MAG TPA: tetratricopeptide repeat protein, partial [Myxococcales bacterium]|nr:tetratricopeptide repeat protein [Myxococcales bacterium]
MIGRYFNWAVLTALLSFSTLVFGQTALEDGYAKLRRGDYSGAIAAFEAVAESGKIADRKGLAQALIATGQLEKAGVQAQKLSKQKAGKSASQVLLARIDFIRGKYRAVIKRLKKEVRVNPANLEARILISEAKLASGAHSDSLQEADEIADLWNEGQVKGAEGLTLLGRALHLTRYYKDANEIFGEALEHNPNYVPAHLYWARLFLEKYDEQQAGQSLDRVLKVNPNHPYALALTAKIDMSSDNDVVKALARIKKALAVNPRCVPALRIHAHILIQTEQLTAALKLLDQALAVNPNDSISQTFQ